MTKVEALAAFKEAFPYFATSDDKVMVRCAWNDYTDSLAKDGQITNTQYHNWSNPFDKE